MIPTGGRGPYDVAVATEHIRTPVVSGSSKGSDAGVEEPRALELIVQVRVSPRGAVAAVDRVRSRGLADLSVDVAATEPGPAVRVGVVGVDRSGYSARPRPALGKDPQARDRDTKATQPLSLGVADEVKGLSVERCGGGAAPGVALSVWIIARDACRRFWGVKKGWAVFAMSSGGGTRCLVPAPSGAHWPEGPCPARDDETAGVLPRRQVLLGEAALVPVHARALPSVVRPGPRRLAAGAVLPHAGRGSPWEHSFLRTLGDWSGWLDGGLRRFDAPSYVGVSSLFGVGGWGGGSG